MPSRPGVLNSWRRSPALHVHADRVELPYVRDPDTDTPLTQAAAPVLHRIAERSLVAGGKCRPDLGRRPGTRPDRRLIRRSSGCSTTCGLARGYSYAEEFAGTNGIGTTLETGQADVHPRQRALRRHPRATRLCRLAHPRTRSPGDLLGVIDLTCWASQADPLLFVLAKSAGSQIEDRLSAMKNETETALLDAYLKQSRRYPAGVLADRWRRRPDESLPPSDAGRRRPDRPCWITPRG